MKTEMRNVKRKKGGLIRVRSFVLGLASCVLLCLSTGCLQEKARLVEKTPPSYEDKDIVMKVEMLENAKEEKQDAAGELNVEMKRDKTGVDGAANDKGNEAPNLLMDEEGIPLELSFAEISGRANPFIPPGAAYGVPSASLPSSSPTPAYAKPSSAVPILAKDPMKGQLMPIAGQKTAVEPAVPPIPEWAGESPILSAGPPERLNSLLNLSYKGLIVSHKGKRAGVIELFVRDDVRNTTYSQSYIVTPGKYVTEYNLKVKELNSQYIVLTRGSQRIELPLVDKPTTLPYAVDSTTAAVQFPQQSPYAQKAGSASQWSPSTATGQGGASQ